VPDIFIDGMIRVGYAATIANIQAPTTTELNAGQFDAVAKEALVVNRGRVDVPFSPAASTLLRTSEPE
jgi:hypothetical protein